jgi:hypothetical protein
MAQRFPLDFECAECAAILRALLDEFHVDHRDVKQRLRETAKASGRSVEEMRNVWVASVARMPPGEMQTLMKAHYPRTSEARRRRKEHEAATGHSVYMHGHRGALGAPFGKRSD